MRFVKPVLAVFFCIALSTCAIGSISVSGTYDPASGLEIPYSGQGGLYTMPYMGGSVLYYADNPSIGHIAAGKKIAVRLGSIKSNGRHDNNPLTTSYGYIKFDSVGTESISFTWYRYGAGGAYTLPPIRKTVANDGAIDLNGDGVADIKYAAPDSARPGMEQGKTRYLTFIAEAGKTASSMFSVLPTEYVGTYPNGLVGINPGGSWIVYAYKYDHSKRTFRKYVNITEQNEALNPNASGTVRQTVLGLKKGDYVIDVDTEVGSATQGMPVYRYVSAGLHETARAVDNSQHPHYSSMNHTVSGTETGTQAQYNAHRESLKTTLVKMDLPGGSAGDKNPVAINDAEIWGDAQFKLVDFNSDWAKINTTYEFISQLYYTTKPEWFGNDSYHALNPAYPYWPESIPQAVIAADDSMAGYFKTRTIDWFNDALLHSSTIASLKDAGWWNDLSPEIQKAINNDWPYIVAAEDALQQKTGQLGALVHSILAQFKWSGVPPLHLSPDEVTAALPQIYLNVTDNYDYYTDPDFNGNASAYTDYTKKRDQAKKDYAANFFTLHTFSLSEVKIAKSWVHVHGGDSAMSVGITGAVTNHWGLFDFQTGAALFLQFETDIVNKEPPSSTGGGGAGEWGRQEIQAKDRSAAQASRWTFR